MQELLAAYGALDDKTKIEVDREISAATSNMLFIPSPGPQTEAWFCKADVLLYGGEPGGGKSGLLCGLALERHHFSLLMRREGTSLQGGGGLIEDLLRINGDRDGFNGSYPPTLRRKDGRIVTFGSANNAGDEQKFQGRPRDLLGIDEAAQFTERQIRYLMAWVRTIKEGQAARTVLASNPPATAEGLWLNKWFAAWLDPKHPNPAKPGELRWFATTQRGGEDVDVEVDGPEPVEIDGKIRYPLSRTFIPASLADNPFLDEETYRRQLSNIGGEFEHIVEGNFMAGVKDHPEQAIPTEWVIAAEERWTEDPPEHAPMCAIGVDPAQGGEDNTVVAARHDSWFAPLSVTPGVETPTGREVAALVMTHRRNGCDIVLDMGGGYGGATKVILEDNGIKVTPHKGANGSNARTVDGQFGFFNKRSQVVWRFREALDPAQDGGSAIALPPDPRLRADLTAPRRSVTTRGIKIESKDDVVARLGRSTDFGDAVMMAWSGGPKLLTHGRIWRAALSQHNAKPRVITSKRR